MIIDYERKKILLEEFIEIFHRKPNKYDGFYDGENLYDFYIKIVNKDNLNQNSLNSWKNNSWEDKLIILEKFIKKYNRKPKREDHFEGISGVTLSNWIKSNSLKNVDINKRKKLMSMLEKYDLLGRIGVDKSILGRRFIKLKNFIEKNKHDNFSEKELSNVFDFNNKKQFNDLLFALKNHDKYSNKINKLYNKYNLNLVKKPYNHSKEYSKLVDFSYKNKIPPTKLAMFNCNKSSFYHWIRQFIQQNNDCSLSKDIRRNVDFNKFKTIFNRSFFDINILKIFDNLNKNTLDLELKRYFLIAEKKPNSKEVVYYISTNREEIKLSSYKENFHPNDIMKVHIKACFDLKIIINRLIKYKYKLNEEEIKILNKYENINFKLNYLEKKYKIIFKEKNNFKNSFLFSDYRDFIVKSINNSVNLYKNSIKDYQDKTSIDYKLFTNLNLNLVYIADKSNLSKQRVSKFLEERIIPYFEKEIILDHI